MAGPAPWGRVAADDAGRGTVGPRGRRPLRPGTFTVVVSRLEADDRAVRDDTGSGVKEFGVREFDVGGSGSGPRPVGSTRRHGRGAGPPRRAGCADHRASGRPGGSVGCVERWWRCRRITRADVGGVPGAGARRAGRGGSRWNERSLPGSSARAGATGGWHARGRPIHDHCSGLIRSTRSGCSGTSAVGRTTQPQCGGRSASSRSSLELERSPQPRSVSSVDCSGNHSARSLVKSTTRSSSRPGPDLSTCCTAASLADPTIQARQSVAVRTLVGSVGRRDDAQRCYPRRQRLAPASRPAGRGTPTGACRSDPTRLPGAPADVTTAAGLAAPRAHPATATEAATAAEPGRPGGAGAKRPYRDVRDRADRRRRTDRGDLSALRANRLLSPATCGYRTPCHTAWAPVSPVR